MNKDIKSFIRPKKQTKLASKKTINLCTTDVKKKPVALFVLGIFGIAALVFCVAKFGVIDQYARANKAEAELAAAQRTTAELEKEASRFKSVRVDYLTYTSNWMGEVNDNSKEALVGVDRQDAIDLVNRIFSPYGVVTRIRIYSELLNKETHQSRDILEVSVITDNMKISSNILAAVKEDPYCEDADWHRSETDAYDHSSYYGYGYYDYDHELAAYGKVETVFTVILKKPEAGENQ